MKPDLYTKAVLTIIMVLLAVIACNHYVSPTTTASAEGPFAGVQSNINGYSFGFLDSRTGEIFLYNAEGKMEEKFRLTKLGQPLSSEFKAK
jgi:hypothetical protein